MKKAIVETDPEIRAAYERWVDGMIDAANCRFTKAVVQIFEENHHQIPITKQLRLKIHSCNYQILIKDAGQLTRLTGDSKKPGTFIGVPPKTECRN